MLSSSPGKGQPNLTVGGSVLTSPIQVSWTREIMRMSLAQQSKYLLS